MYVTGCLGGTTRGEAFLPDLHLPNDTAYTDARVEADAGCVALARGPLIYCFEGADSPVPPARVAPA